MRHRQPQPGVTRPASFVARIAACLATAWMAGGCSAPDRALITRPARHSVRAEQLLVLSNFKLPSDHAMIAELTALREEIRSTLKLPPSDKSVVIYIFDDEQQYRRYLGAVYPELPHRRAYFVGNAAELAVFTYWGGRTREDLRHEFTHGLLHASLNDVPVWLDEGLAEYFEVAPSEDGERTQRGYARDLTKRLAAGWQPDLTRLEDLSPIGMRRADYAEAWGWVRYMLHGSPATRKMLLAYLHDLASNRRVEPLSRRLARQLPDYRERFTAWAGIALATGIRTARGD